MAILKLALVQMDSRDDVEANLAQVVKYIKLAKQGGADIVAFPEFMNFLAFSRTNMYFEGVDGRTTRLLQSLAVDNDIIIQAGSILIDSGSDRPYNQTFIVDRDGSLKGRYSKVHLFDGIATGNTEFRESTLYTPGNSIVVSEIMGVKVGTAICYDFRFPDLFRIMARAGAKIIFVPGNFTVHGGKHKLEAVMQTRAIENGVFIVSADQVGTKKKSESYGHSMVISPDGDILAIKEEGEGLLFCEIDTLEVNRQRLRLPLLEHNREDVYEIYRKKLKDGPLK